MYIITNNTTNTTTTTTSSITPSSQQPHPPHPPSPSQPLFTITAQPTQSTDHLHQRPSPLQRDRRSHFNRESQQPLGIEIIYGARSPHHRGRQPLRTRARHGRPILQQPPLPSPSVPPYTASMLVCACTLQSQQRTFCLYATRCVCVCASSSSYSSSSSSSSPSSSSSRSQIAPLVYKLPSLH